MAEIGEKTKASEKSSMPFLEHLEELRKRLIRSLAAVVVCSIAAFVFSDEIIQFIQIPLRGVPLHNWQVTGVFTAYFKVSLIAGIIVALPYVFLQLWGFISPGLYAHEKSRVVPIVIASTLLFLVGGGFCFWVVLPLALDFLIHFGEGRFINYITVGSYISFAGFLVLAFGLVFQLPVVAFFLGKFGIITSNFLAKGRRYAIVIILIVAGVLTPSPDIFTQLLMAVPLYILYEISIIIVKVTNRPRPPAVP